MKLAAYRTMTLIIGICLLCQGIHSQEVRVRTEIDTNRILMGDQVWFSVTLEQPADLRLDLLKFRDTIVKNIEILTGPVTDTTLTKDGILHVRDRYLITSFDSGNYEIPPIYAEMPTPEGIRRFYSDYLYLSVTRPDIVPADSTMQFFDIIPPYRAPVTVGEALPWILGLVAAGVIAFFVIMFIRSRKKVPVGEEPALIQEAAHVIAYRNLEKLRNEKLWQRGLFKQYYSRLSDILRIYIDMRFGLNTMESTTREILSVISKIDLMKGEAYDSLKQVLELSDMVKFAKLIPDSSDCEINLDQSWSFVSLTRKDNAMTDEAQEQDHRDIQNENGEEEA
ncbi:MAG: hypothetical protein RBS37_12090 [Bacteroidales bacterium]|jgi:hypothetical protein|nr:hypothetical protein [Bacteroidales bacterium]